MAEAAVAEKVFEYIRPKLYAAQESAIFTCLDPDGLPARYAVIEASTKAGKTVGCMAWFVEQAYLLGKPNRNFWWVAPVYPQAKIAFRRIKNGLVKGTFTANETDLTIRLHDIGSIMWFKSGEKPDNLYGEDVFAAVVDEASRCREDSWVALRSTLTATRGSVRIIGNVKGRNNWHYKLARRAEQGASGYAYAKLTAYDAVKGGVIKLEEVEDAKRTLPEQVFKELYLAQPSEDEGNPFGFKHIEACLTPDISTEKCVAIGIDLAKSHDWTVVIGLDRYGAVCGFERWQSTWEMTESRILGLIGHVPTLIDSTGVGDPIVERLQRSRPSVNGFKFSSQSKQRLMEGLALAIQQQRVRFPDCQIRAELDVFEYAYTRTGAVYSAPEGMHDDCVCALALAVQQYSDIYQTSGSILPDGVPRISPWVSADNRGDY